MLEKILVYLNKNKVEYELLEHDHVHTSKDAASVRGTRIEEAAKALILKAGSSEIFMCVVSGHKRLDLKKIKVLVGERNCSLAHPKTVLEKTGLKVGTIPPFANLFEPPLRMYADEDVFTREFIVFSAGTHHHSIRMKSADWKRITRAVVERIAC